MSPTRLAFSASAHGPRLNIAVYFLVLGNRPDAGARVQFGRARTDYRMGCRNRPFFDLGFHLVGDDSATNRAALRKDIAN